MSSSQKKLPSRVHIIGICGVATSALAIALHKRGVAVTGSDKGFYPPVSTGLEEQGVPFYAGWHPENMIAHGTPDIVIAGGIGTSLSNPEIIYATEHRIPLISFAEALARFVIKDESIVVTGTWGKTTISALLSYILIGAGLDPSYFSGGLSLSHDTGAVTDSRWSVVEGDEYQISISDRRPKFVVYKPKYLLLTSVSWDHADLYPTEEKYFTAFKKMVEEIPVDGSIISCADNDGAVKLLGSTTLKDTQKIISYGKFADADYRYDSVQPSKNGLRFSIYHNGATHDVSSPMFGRFNAENITAAFSMAHSIGIAPEKILESIQKFKGIKRRFEKRLEKDVTIFDCHAPTAEKAASVLASIREVYDKKIYAVYEPNIGGRQHASAGAYDNAFKDADMIIIPRLTKLKITENGSDQPMEGDELAATISRTHPQVKSIADDTEVVDLLASNTKKDDCIVFLGSHGFRGMIEATVEKLKK